MLILNDLLKVIDRYRGFKIFINEEKKEVAHSTLDGKRTIDKNVEPYLNRKILLISYENEDTQRTMLI